MTRAALAALAVLLLAAACGKVGPVRAPGPPSAITYPRQYPAPEPPPRPATEPTTRPAVESTPQ
ncbi:hypothetical protein [Neoroseomonas lacus]|uniref:Lipoprotein n=1 Tax=Neoroseomonas lacus TaxID=287609 RepID=A0A917L2R6_9PROT|nr:hypothetical protein [Neoroseomonas lacus]GGJ36958.1 hypothetical protein GCM10011320_50770 [Neoroseomonas lacus]